MSRLAKKPIAIPDGVKVTINQDVINVEGKLGKISQKFLPQYIDIVIQGNELMVNRKEDGKPFRATQGLFYRITGNLIKGVSEGFTKQLNIQGLGFKWEIKGKELVLIVGFSKPAVYMIPEGITLKLERPDLLAVTGIDKQLVGQSAANIRGIRPPEPYKGKGVRYADERVKLKEGKSAK